MRQSVSKGFVYMMSTELVVMISNYLIHIGLARYLGAEDYGLFGVLMSMYLINRAFLNTGLPRTVTKFISESNVLTHTFYSKVLKLQIFSAVGFALLYVILASSIASWLHDSSLTGMIMFLGVMVIPLSLLALFTSGYMNGLRVFREQAIISFSQPIFRVILVFLFVFLGWGIFGALMGYFLALVLCLILFFIIWKNPVVKSDTFIEERGLVKKVLLFSLPITFTALAATSIRNINVLFIKSILHDNTLAGLYTAATTLSNIPFLLFMYLPFVLLPSVSRAVAQQNHVLIQKYIKLSLRWLLLLMLPVIALMAATSTDLLKMFYSSTYIGAASTLSLLVVSVTFLVIFGTLGSIITGSGKPTVEMCLTWLSFLLMVILNYYFIPHYGIVGGAISSLIATCLAMVMGGFYVYRKWGVLVDAVSTVKIVIVSGLVYYLAWLWHFAGFYLVFTYGLWGLFYVFVLWLLREIRKEDWEVVGRLFRKRSLAEYEKN